MTRVCSGEEVSKLVKGLVHAKTQIQEHALDLTLRSVFKLTGRGSLDFGGSEYCPCEGDKILPIKRQAGDKHGWWELNQGDYLMEYNESFLLPEGTVGILQPHHRVVMAGAIHNNHILIYPDVLPAALLHVGSMGINIKQNARVSQLVVLKVD
ncbi:MAG: hypothetical protein AB1696_20970 [Planctomycetota bacterium]